MKKKTLNMGRSYKFSSPIVDRLIPDNQKYGNYALGWTTEDGKTFMVQYVGRSDKGLNTRLKQHLDEGYPRFKFSICSSAKEAFEEECRNWHDFGGPRGALDNSIHPDRPDGKHYKCPFCEIFNDE